MFEAEVKDGHVEVPREWPDGFKVRIEPIDETPVEEPSFVKIGMDESDWDDSPEGRIAWNERLDTLEPIDWPEPNEYDEMNRQYNLDAVRKLWESFE